MVSNLVPRQVPGVGGESEYIDSHLLDKAGRLRDLNKVAKEIGNLIVQFAYLDYQLREHLRRPMARGYPPKIFISYRRETPEHVRWCMELARELKNAGYEVMLDALAVPDGDTSPEVIGRFVGQLATADVALAVLTPSYPGTESGPPTGMRRWIYEEWVRIAVLRDWGLLEVVGIIRAGDWKNSVKIREGEWANELVSFSGKDALIDLSGRSPADLRPVLDFFGRYSGPRIPEADGLLLAQNAGACITASRERDEPTAAMHLSRIERFQETEEFRVANVSYHAAFRSPQAALQLFREARAKNPTLPASAELATSLWRADLDNYAFQTMAEIAESPSRWQGEFHWYMGDILEQEGFLRSALNHLSWCTTIWPPSLGGQPKQLPGELNDQVREYITRISGKIANGTAAFRRSPERRLPKLDKQCDICGARYSSAGAACELCGALYAKAATHCEMCGFTVTSLRQLRFCPVCRKSFSGAPGSVRVGHLVTPRFPAGRFSVLWPQGKPVTGSLCKTPAGSRQQLAGRGQQGLGDHPECRPVHQAFSADLAEGCYLGPCSFGVAGTVRPRSWSAKARELVVGDFGGE